MSEDHKFAGLVSRLHPAFQCCTLNVGRVTLKSWVWPGDEAKNFQHCKLTVRTNCYRYVESLEPMEQISLLENDTKLKVRGTLYQLLF